MVDLNKLRLGAHIEICTFCVKLCACNEKLQKCLTLKTIQHTSVKFYVQGCNPNMSTIPNQTSRTTKQHTTSMVVIILFKILAIRNMIPKAGIVMY